MSTFEEKTQAWLQIAAIILGLVIHGSVIGYQLGKLTQLVSGMETRLVASETAIRMAEKELTGHKISHPDRLLDKRLTVVERECGLTD